MAWNIADLIEHIVDTVPDRVALIVADEPRTYAQLEERANRLAHHLQAQGIGPGDHVGIYGMNSHAFVETIFAAYKLRAVPVNVNYRYVEAELRYLFDNADLVALVHDAEFAPRIAAVRDALPMLRHLVAIDDGSGEDTSTIGSVDYEEALAAASPERDFGERSDDDIYILYTGGTTGMPKGVVWRQEDVLCVLGGLVELRHRYTRPRRVGVREGRGRRADRCRLRGRDRTPHARRGAMGDDQRPDQRPHDRAHPEVRCARRVASGREVQDPDIEHHRRRHGPPTDRGARRGRLRRVVLVAVASTAAVFSATVKAQFHERFPNLVIADAVGSTETGYNGVRVIMKGGEERPGLPTVRMGPDTVVLDDDMNIVQPGSGVVGRMARGGNVPLRYHKDPEKSAATFVTVNGRRYSVSGDSAVVEADGTMTLLGRGSVCINSGGEKIYPEEVEAAVEGAPGRVRRRRRRRARRAMGRARRGRHRDATGTSRHPRGARRGQPLHVAGYKVPRELHVVDKIERSPSGKPDYPWAKRIATSTAS